MVYQCSNCTCVYHFLWQLVPHYHHHLCEKGIPQVPFKSFPTLPSFGLPCTGKKYVTIHLIYAPNDLMEGHTTHEYNQRAWLRFTF